MSERTAMCWDHCKDGCGRSQSRFWVSSKEQFEKERVENDPRPCQFCGGKLVSYHEPNALVFPEKDESEVEI